MSPGGPVPPSGQRSKSGWVAAAPRESGGLDDAGVAAQYHRDPVRSHFVPASFAGGPLRTGELASRSGSSFAYETTSRAAHPGATQHDASKSRSRGELLRRRKEDRAVGLVSSPRQMVAAAEQKLRCLASRFVPEVPYVAEFDLNGDGRVDAYEALVMKLADSTGDGSLNPRRHARIQDILDRGDIAALSSMQDRSGGGARLAVTWWNSSEESKRDRRRKESAAAAKTAARDSAGRKHGPRDATALSSCLLESMGIPVLSLARARHSQGLRPADAEGPFCSDSTLGPERRTMAGRQDPGLRYMDRPRFRSRQAMLEWRRIERTHSSASGDISGSPTGSTPEEALQRHLRMLGEQGRLSESNKAVMELLGPDAPPTRPPLRLPTPVASRAASSRLPPSHVASSRRVYSREGVPHHSRTGAPASVDRHRVSPASLPEEPANSHPAPTSLSPSPGPASASCSARSSKHLARSLDQPARMTRDQRFRMRATGYREAVAAASGHSSARSGFSRAGAAAGRNSARGGTALWPTSTPATPSGLQGF